MRRIILVAGASRGLGLCLVSAHLSLGDRVIAYVRTETAGLGSVKDAYPAALTVLRADVADTASIIQAGEDTKALASRLDILYNNAGVHSFDDRVPLEDTDMDRLLWYYNINAVGPMRVLKALSPLLKTGSVVVNISSEAGSIAQCRRDSEYGYCMSKAAMNMGMRLFANATREKGVRFFAIHPGWMRTDMGGPDAALSPEQSAKSILSIALHPEKIPEDQAFIGQDRKPWQW